MFSFKPASKRLMNIYIGIALGMAAAILYLTFLLVHSYSYSTQMILLPLTSVGQSEGRK